MARRRRSFNRGSGPARTMSWVVGQNDGTPAAHTLGPTTPLESVLFIPLEDHEAATVVRIVGQIWARRLVSASGTVVNRISWGIYIAGSGSEGDLKMDPVDALDQDSQHWMHIRHDYQHHGIADTAGLSDRLTQDVDIKVMRKVREGDGIKLVANASVDFSFGAALRILIKHT